MEESSILGVIGLVFTLVVFMMIVMNVTGMGDAYRMGNSVERGDRVDRKWRDLRRIRRLRRLRSRLLDEDY